MVGTGLVFSAIFHIGTKEPRKEGSADQSSATAATQSKTHTVIGMEWKDWFREHQFYQVQMYNLKENVSVGFNNSARET